MLMNDMMLKVNITTLYTYYILIAKAIESIFISPKECLLYRIIWRLSMAMSMKKLTCNEVNITQIAYTVSSLSEMVWYTNHTGGGEEKPFSLLLFGMHKMWAWWISGTVWTFWSVQENKHGVSWKSYVHIRTSAMGEHNKGTIGCQSIFCLQQVSEQILVYWNYRHSASDLS